MSKGMDSNTANDAAEARRPEAELDRIAHQVTTEIGLDFPDLDMSYDLYVEVLRRRDNGDQQVYGVIDAGDVLLHAYEWDGAEWDLSLEDPHEIKARILASRIR